MNSPRTPARKGEGPDAHAHGVTTRTRMTRRARHDEIMAAALRLACDIGYTHVTRDDIALAVGCSPAVVSEFFGTMVSLRRSIQRAAVANHVLPVIAQGLALRDPHALRAPAELRAVAAGSIVYADHGTASRQRPESNGNNLGFNCANTALNWPVALTAGLLTGSPK